MVPWSIQRTASLSAHPSFLLRVDLTLCRSHSCTRAKPCRVVGIVGSLSRLKGGIETEKSSGEKNGLAPRGLRAATVSLRLGGSLRVWVPTLLLRHFQVAERVRDPYRVAWGLPWAKVVMASAPNAFLAFSPLVSESESWCHPYSPRMSSGSMDATLKQRYRFLSDMLYDRMHTSPEE